jgi:hypothetical protein
MWIHSDSVYLLTSILSLFTFNVITATSGCGTPWPDLCFGTGATISPGDTGRQLGMTGQTGRRSGM